MRRLPIVLPFTLPAADQPDAVEDIGMSWQDHTFELGALVIEAAGGLILSIRHIARRDVTCLESTQRDRAGGTKYIELLQPCEFIQRIEYRYTAQGVVGLRMQTTLRTSQWVGGPRGSVNAIDAPSGYFINALVGFRSAVRCQLLGALSCPFSIIPIPIMLSRGLRSLRYGAGFHDGTQREFEESADNVHAIVVRCDFHVMRVWVLSTEAYESFQAFKDSSPLGPNEFCLELSRDEVIQCVYIQSHKVVNAIRIHTNHRQTPWWGRAAFGNITNLDCRRDGRSFVGFHGTMGEHYVGSLGVLYS